MMMMRTLEQRLQDIGKCPHCNSVQGEIVQSALTLLHSNGSDEDRAQRELDCTWCGMRFTDNYSLKSTFTYTDGSEITDTADPPQRVRRCINCNSKDLAEEFLRAGLPSEQDQEDLILRNLTCRFCGHDWQDKFMLTNYDILVAGDPEKGAW